MMLQPTRSLSFYRRQNTASPATTPIKSPNGCDASQNPKSPIYSSVSLQKVDVEVKQQPQSQFLDSPLHSLYASVPLQKVNIEEKQQQTTPSSMGSPSSLYASVPLQKIDVEQVLQQRAATAQLESESPTRRYSLPLRRVSSTKEIMSGGVPITTEGDEQKETAEEIKAAEDFVITFHSLAYLQERNKEKNYQGLLRCHLEKHLTDDDFFSWIKMTKVFLSSILLIKPRLLIFELIAYQEAFYAQPLWKRKEQKKKSNIF